MRTLLLAAIALLIAPSAAHAVPIGQGFKPSVAVDANGTAYIAWYGPETTTSSLQFCRLPRGAAACDSQQAIAAQGTSLSRPFVIVSGSIVRIVQYRYGISVPQVFVFTSGDGGVTFDAGRAAGDMAFDEAVVGGDGTLTVATNAFSGGGVVQTVPLASGSADGSATLFGGERPYNGTVGLAPDGRRVAIFATGASDAAFRLHSGSGSPNNAATWGAPVGLGYAEYPRLATGGLGLFLLAGDGAVPQGMFVRRWTGDTFGAPVTVAPGDASESDLSIDPGGRLHAVWSRLDAQGYHLQHSVSDDGATWRSGSVFAQTEDQVGAPRVAAAADHVGVAVWASRSGGVSQINATAIGPDAPVVPPTQPPPVQPPPADPAPQFNQTFVVRPVRGVVRVRLRGSNRFVNITTIDDIPFGATIDTKRGEVELRSVASRTGTAQSVRLFDGWFRVSFSRGITNFTLNEPLARCPRRGSAAQRKPKSRKLWGNGKGKFRTTGNYSAATVRGTRWLVQDTCAGTRTRVRQGSVSVRDRVRKRTVVIRAPRGTYLARPRR